MSLEEARFHSARPSKCHVSRQCSFMPFPAEPGRGCVTYLWPLSCLAIALSYDSLVSWHSASRDSFVMLLSSNVRASPAFSFSFYNASRYTSSLFHFSWNVSAIFRRRIVRSGGALALSSGPGACPARLDRLVEISYE